MFQWSNTWPDVVEQAKENKNFVIILPLIFFSAACRAQKTAEQGFDGSKWKNLDWLQVDMEIHWFKLHILCVSIRIQWEVVSHWIYLYMIKLHAKPDHSFNTSEFIPIDTDKLTKNTNCWHFLKQFGKFQAYLAC